jgi:F-type H+-transporting ATPase subunit delta
MSWRAIRVLPRLISKRGYAAAAAAHAEASDELRLTLASPYKAFFTNAVVRQVDVPTQAGIAGILAKHVPTIGVLRAGVLQVYDKEGTVTKLFISSGTLSMNIDGSCQVLCEEAVPLDQIDETLARQELEAAQRKLAEGGSDAEKTEAQIRVEVAESLIKAVTEKH